MAQRGVHTELGVSSNAVRQARRNFKDGKITEDLMLNYLRKAGYEEITDRSWGKPIGSE